MPPENDDQGGSLPFDDLLWIDQVGTRFEEAWKAAPPSPQPEAFLGDAQGPKRDALLRELLALDLEFRQQVESPGARAQGRPQSGDTPGSGAVESTAGTTPRTGWPEPEVHIL